MLRLIYPSGLPVGIFPADPSVEFQAGMICGLKQIGNDIFLTVSDGVTIQPFGIIDDVRTHAYSRPVLDEEVIVPAVADEYGKSLIDVTGYLKYPNIIAKSFSSDISVILNPVNGVITIPKGTPLNYSMSGGAYDSIKVTCSYIYEVANWPGDDTTLGSSNMTAHICRCIVAVDTYDTTVAYPLNSVLYCSKEGLWTTRPNGPGIGMTLIPPSSYNNELTLLFF